VQSGEKRRFVVLLGVLGLVASAFFGRMVLGGGGGDDGAGEERVAQRVAARDAGKARAGAKPGQVEDDLGPSETFEVFATRDPFEPPFNPTPTSPPPTSPPATGGSPGTSPPTGPPQTPPPATQPPSFDPGGGEAVALLDVFDQGGVVQARVRVGSTVYTVGEGDTFATSYQVVALEEPCGDFLFGDSPFELCEGEETIK
jgi:hypothetical protein